MSFSIFLYFAHFNCKIAISPLQRSAPSSRHPPSSLLDISFHQLPQQKLLFIFPGYSHTSCFKLALFYLHLETFHLSVLEGADYLSYDSHMNTSIILIILELLKWSGDTIICTWEYDETAATTFSALRIHQRAWSLMLHFTITMLKKSLQSEIWQNAVHTSPFLPHGCVCEYVCSCICYILSTKISILPAKWGRSSHLPRPVWEFRLGLKAEIRTGLELR